MIELPGPLARSPSSPKHKPTWMVWAKGDKNPGGLHGVWLQSSNCLFVLREMVFFWNTWWSFLDETREMCFLYVWTNRIWDIIILQVPICVRVELRSLSADLNQRTICFVVPLTSIVVENRLKSCSLLGASRVSHDWTTINMYQRSVFVRFIMAYRNYQCRESEWDDL